MPLPLAVSDQVTFTPELDNKHEISRFALSRIEHELVFKVQIPTSL